MKRAAAILPVLIAGMVFCSGQNVAPSGVFPGPGSSPPPTCTAFLDGAHAIPPNNSPFTATALARPQVLPVSPYGYDVYFVVQIPPSLVTNHPNIGAAVIGIQRRDGSYVMDPYCTPPDECPFTLGPPPGPGAPCFNTTNGWVCPPLPIGIFEGRFGLTSDQLAELRAGQWYANVTFQSGDGMPAPDYTIRGQFLPVDSDHDGVPDFEDQCPGTPPDAVIDADGCSIEQLCPCEGPWRNHGQFVNCVKAATADFQRAGLISADEARSIVKDATTSHCGSR